MKTNTQQITVSALLAALIFVATRFIQVPLPAVGYVNMGDGLVILTGWLLSPGYGFLAAGIGAALADILSPFVIYSPATFIIKGLMAVIVNLIFKAMGKKANNILCVLTGGLVSEIIMVLGYLLFEGILYGVKTALLSVPFNLIQGAIGLIFGIILINILAKTKIIR